MLFSSTVVLALTAALTAMLWYGLNRSSALAPWLFCWITALSLTTFLTYGFDKWQASNGRRRVPELTLHLLALLGGSAGALAGMYLFRHKTVKGPFRILFWLIVAVQLVAMIWLAKQMWWT